VVAAGASAQAPNQKKQAMTSDFEFLKLKLDRVRKGLGIE
jgi:hypothetical protein